MEVGQLCVKTAGRDAKGKCVIVDVIDSNYVLVDGNVRRRKCNVKHLEPLHDKIDIKKNAPHEDVVSAFKKLGIELREKKPKEQKPKPKKLRGKEKSAEEPVKKQKSAPVKKPISEPKTDQKDSAQ